MADVSRVKRACLFLLLGLGILRPSACFADVQPAGTEDAVARIAAIEQRVGGRIGVAALDLASGRRIGHRAGERFAMCSTFKLAAAAAVLHRIDQHEEQLERVIRYTEADLLEYAPITKEHVHEGGMALDALCAAAIEYSDNTAGNLLLATIGGPAGLTSYFRSLGDNVSRLDRNEPTLNDVRGDDMRDTTSPNAMLANLQTLMLGDALTRASRAKMNEWLAASTPGGKLIRAGVPPGWQVGDKTGRGGDNAINDIAMIRPPDRAPILLCVYLAGGTAPTAARETAIAEIARIVAETFR